MATYRAIAASETDALSPITSDLMTALADNPTAIAEGADDAPYNETAWHPYDGVTWGDGNDGLFYDFAVDGALAEVETPTFADGYEYRIVFNGIVAASGAPAMFTKLYPAVSATWTTAAAISGPLSSASEYLWGHITYFRPRWAVTHHVFSSVWNVSGTYAAGTPRQGIDVSTAQKIDKAVLGWGGAINTAGGKMYLLRRRAFAP